MGKDEAGVPQGVALDKDVEHLKGEVLTLQLFLGQEEAQRQGGLTEFWKGLHGKGGNGGNMMICDGIL